MDFLELRKQIKEDILKKKRIELSSEASASGSFQKNLPYDNFGTFFGASQTIIAQRVIDESLPAPEAKKVASKAKRSVKSNIKKLVHLMEQKKIIETLRYSRDYSFLNSPDSEIPKCPAKPAVQCLMSSKPQQKNTQDQSKLVPKPVLSNPRNQPETNTIKRCEVSDRLKGLATKPASGTKRRPKYEQDLRETKKAKLVSENFLPPEHQVPQGCSKVSSQLPFTKEQVKKVPEHNKEKKMEHAEKVPEPDKEKRIGQTKNAPDSTKSGAIKEMKEKRISTRAKSSLKRKTSRPIQGIFHDEDVESEFDSILQMLSRRNVRGPVKRDDYDDDADCMVSSFRDIEKEERKSAKIARKEDETERLRIEQEAREERLRREAKSKKQQQGICKFF